MAFKKGHKINKGRKHSASTIKKISLSRTGQPSYWKGKRNPTKGIPRPNISNENSPLWKGSGAKYKAIHMWVGRHKGRASSHKCTYCSNKAREWSNLDHRYKRNLDDYVPVCSKCHFAYDSKL